jgi:protein-S-isoprenylcysteine O-methyltransferase Ste14
MNDNKKNMLLRTVVLMLFFIIVIPLSPLLISRHWDWWEAWVYAGISIISFAISRFLAARRNPDILRERARFMQHENAKDFDRILAPLVGLGGGIIPLIAGLDELFHWSPGFGPTVKIISLIIILAGYTLASYALIENRFFSGVVRIQTDRNHKVVSGGPYRWVRHPGYAGSLITYPVIPLLLDSQWTYIPAFLLIIILVIRTYLEDNTLQLELPGYADYAQKVRYRLIPGVW